MTLRMTPDYRDALAAIASRTGGSFTSLSEGLSPSLEVAMAMGWDLGRARIESSKHLDSSLSLIRGYLGPQPAAVFASNGGLAPSYLVPTAAQFAYHSTIHWGLAIDREKIVIFNSHWISHNQWFQLPPIRWTEINSSLELLAAASPQGITSGQLEWMVLRDQKPDQLLSPVDDALVARLGFWRKEALLFGKEVVSLDTDLHTLFAQLFVLRAVEDRKLSPDVPALSTSISGGSLNVAQLRLIYRAAASHVQSELFTLDLFDRFPDPVLRGIVEDLYVPKTLPAESQHYNFAWIDADVLGRAYEKYLATVFLPAPLAPQLRLWDQPERALEPISVKRSGGVYYTPQYLVGAITETAIEAVFESHPEPNFIPTIADFSCGSGSFLVEAVGALLRRLRRTDPQRNWARLLIENQHVIGIDIDERAVQIARLNLWIRFTEEPNALPLPSIQNAVVVGDSLGTEVWDILPSQFDLVLGNPPFVATGSAVPRDDLARRFESARGRFDFAYLFVELALQRLRDGGILGVVVPNRLFMNRDASTVRRLLANLTQLQAIVDFGSNEVFSGTSAYIGAISARRTPADQIASTGQVRVVKVVDVSDSRYLGSALIEAIDGISPRKTDILETFEIPTPIGGNAWILLGPASRTIRLKFEESGDPLGSVAAIFQGIRTGANDIFILNLESTDTSLVQVTNALGEAAILESTLLHPVVFGADIRRYRPLQSDRLLLYPYRDGAVIPERELAEQYPSTYSYLTRYREYLAGRSTILSRNFRWYELAWQRDEAWLHSPKIVSRDLARRTSFTMDISGDVFLVGGTAVLMPSPELLFPLLAFINSSFASQFLTEMTPIFRGGFQKFEPQHLGRLPVPRFILDQTPDALEMGSLAEIILTSSEPETTRSLEDRIDAIVSSVLQLD